MRLTKSFLCGISALVLATATAFAGQDTTADLMASESEMEVIYIYPLEVTEYYLIIPQSPELG